MWECNGITGHGSQPSLAGTQGGRCVVAATGSRCCQDLAVTLDILGPTTIISVNNFACFYPGAVHHMCALDHNYLGTWLQLRKLRFGDDPVSHSTSERFAQNAWQFNHNSGTSSMFAIQVALAMGYDQVWTVGVQLDNDGYFYNPWIKVNYSSDNHRHVRRAMRDFLHQEAHKRVFTVSTGPFAETIREARGM